MARRPADQVPDVGRVPFALALRRMRVEPDVHQRLRATALRLVAAATGAGA